MKSGVVFKCVVLWASLLSSVASWSQAVCSLDVDGDGRYLAATDAVILTRLALGMTGDAVVAGALTSASTRRTYEDVRAYLMQNCNLATLQFAMSSLSAKPTRVAISRGDQAILNLTYLHTNPIPDAARLRISGVAAYTIDTQRQPNGVWKVTLRTPPTLPVGRVALSVVAELCPDASCASVLTNSYAVENITLDVTTPDWTAHHGNKAQTGYVPMSFANVNFQRLWDWSAPRPTPTEATALTAATSEAGMVAISSTGYGPQSVFVLNEQSGQLIWTNRFLGVDGTGVPALNPPSIFGGQVFVTTSGHGDTFMYAFKASDGTRQWRTAFSAQWDHYLAPTISDGRVFQNAGYYGGVSTFDAQTGETLWSNTQLPQFDMHALAIDRSTAYAFVSQSLYAFDAANGTLLFQMYDPNSPSTFYSMNRAPAVIAPGKILAGSEGGALVLFDTTARTIVWRSTNTYRGQPAYRDGVIYAYGVNPQRLDAINADNGTVAWSWTPAAASTFCGNVLVTDTHVFASGSSGTYAVNLSTRTSDWSDPMVGRMTLTGGRTLLIKSACGNSSIDTLSGFRVLN